MSGYRKRESRFKKENHNSGCLSPPFLFNNKFLTESSVTVLLFDSVDTKFYTHGGTKQKQFSKENDALKFYDSDVDFMFY